MRTKIIYELDKTKDEDLEYANLLDAMIVAFNIAKASGHTEDMPVLDYEIVDNVDTKISTYSFAMDVDMADGLLQKDEIKSVLANFMGGL
jgi:hypothetical protein